MANTNQKNFMPILITAVVILFLACGYLIFDRSQLSSSKQEIQSQLVEAAEMHTQLQTSFDDASNQLEEFKSDNVALNSLIEEQKSELATQKEKINNLIWTEKNYKKAQQEINSLKEMTANYIAEINTLKEQNTQLASANSELQEETQVLAQEVARTTEENSELTTKKIELENYNKELSKERDYLSEKVDIASVVEVNDIIATGYKIKDNEKLASRSYAKYVDQISVCFTTEDNLITDFEEEEFYLRVIDPLGETMSIEDLGSGILIKSDDKQPVKYTVSNTIEYDNKEQQACIEWNPGMRFPKGIYEIEIYNKGYLAGKTNLRLK